MLEGRWDMTMLISESVSSDVEFNGYVLSRGMGGTCEHTFLISLQVRLVLLVNSYCLR